jgi:hypothetical protein
MGVKKAAGHSLLLHQQTYPAFFSWDAFFTAQSIAAGNTRKTILKAMHE